MNNSSKSPLKIAGNACWHSWSFDFGASTLPASLGSAGAAGPCGGRAASTERRAGMDGLAPGAPT
eukprot:6822278-Pyramimonas_sp.AAC.1